MRARKCPAPDYGESKVSEFWMWGGKVSSNAQPLEGAKQKFYGTGRRKESVARVFLTFGSGKITINGRTPDEYFRNVTWRNRAVGPMKFTETSGSVDVIATVNGGGGCG